MLADGISRSPELSAMSQSGVENPLRGHSGAAVAVQRALRIIIPQN